MGAPVVSAPSTTRLRDGRDLAFYEFGDPSGVPCLATTGTPASGLLGVLWDAPARAAGVRWISIDKPGYGHSSFDPRRSLSRYVEDVRELAASLKLDRFVVVGESGGGPHALALAAGMPEHVSRAIVISGVGPGGEAWVRRGMRPSKRRLLVLGKHAPWLLRPMMKAMGQALRKPDGAAAFKARAMKGGAPADLAFLTRHPDVLDALFVSAADAFRNGSRAAAQEYSVLTDPWEFHLDDITVPVELWHGTEDLTVPVGVAHEIDRRLPDSRLHLIEGGGHLAVFEHTHEVLAAIVGENA